jgi:predicted kinase
LYWLEQADLRGRACPDLGEQLEIIELFRLRCEELGIWDSSNSSNEGTPPYGSYPSHQPWADWRLAIEQTFAARPPAFQTHAFHAAVRDAEEGTIQSVEEAIARAYQLQDPAPQLTMLWGPAGSGKSEWITRHARDAAIVSLDDLRQQIAGKRADQSMNGQVIQAAKEQLKSHLRRQGHIIWDATNLRRELRSAILQLGFDYGAHVRIIALKTPLPTLLSRNKKRLHPIPESVLLRQCETLEWPDAEEAHEVVEG